MSDYFTADCIDHIEAWVFDLDNTLYPTTPEMLAQIDDLMGSFISDFLSVDRVEARRIQKGYFRSYGLTLRGLMIEHGLEPQVYIDHLSRVDLSGVRPDPQLADTLANLGGRKFIYTNAFTEHTREVMERIGIVDHFDGVFDISDAGFVPKPAIESYRRLCELHDINPSRAVMVEDIARNLEPAAELGMRTVWVRTDTDWAKANNETSHINYVTDNLSTWLRDVINRS
ncbi:MAG: hypothetical protein CFH41_02642 [Alphaproteobacteria bacterium MarineAlpha11_Bin1]|nr:MAG: hypothetical protein CFH41_02642 [Alphaproteobacteria bacterium MarineAlpha11_Bin1]|tara:strand:- start:9558 stop:10241 length:684 start_codon:yes stop_codon:yes gene_type:complete